MTWDTFTRRGALGLLGAALAPATYAATAGTPRNRPFTIDTMAPSKVGFDGRRAIADGLSAAVVDLEVPVRNASEISSALAQWNDLVARPDASWHLVRNDADFDVAIRSGRFGLVLACQDPAILGTPNVASGSNLKALRDYFERGLRVLQLSYTDRSILGDGYRERGNAGLSDLGLRVVAEMNRLGMLIDVSHCGDATTDEAIRRSSKPIAVTHAGARSLFASGRNKSDETIRLLGDRGGYFGVFNMTMWLTASDHSSVEDIVDHMMYVRKVGGSGLVGFGSDFPVTGDLRSQAEKVADMQSFEAANKGYPGGEGLHGHMSATDLDGPDRMLVLERALRKRGLRADEIDGILGLNFRRVFRAACN